MDTIIGTPSSGLYMNDFYWLTKRKNKTLLVNAYGRSGKNMRVRPELVPTSLRSEEQYHAANTISA